MNRHMVFWSVLAAGLMMSVVTFGQEQRQGRDRGMTRGMFGRGSSTSGMLRSEAVQKELNITDEQKQKIQELTTQLREGMGNIREMSQEDRTKAMQDMRKKMEEMEKQVVKLLDKKQAKRIEEIRIQAAGLRVVLEKEIAEKLALTDEQKAKIKTANEAVQKKMQEARSSGSYDREAMTKAREDLEAKLKELLTEEQVAKLEKLKGKEFDLSTLRQRRGGGGRGGN